MFSEEFRARLRTGKYSRWAVDLTEEQLELVLWRVGEYAFRAPTILNFLKRHREHFSASRSVSLRIRYNLEALWRAVLRKHVGLDAHRRQLRLLMDEAEWAGEAHFTSPSGAWPTARWPILWQDHPVGWLEDITVYDNFCVGKWVSADTPKTADFLANFQRPSPHVVKIRVLGVLSEADGPPDERGEFVVTRCLDQDDAGSIAPEVVVEVRSPRELE